MTQNYINHIVFVLDSSGSMSNLREQVIKVFDNQIKYLAARSQELDQETRVSVYVFNDDVNCLIYDKDCLRLPSIKDFYKTGGNTALIDATMKSLDDLSKTPELYGDHSYLAFLLTDGEENSSNHSSSTLSNRIKSLPENWTLAVLVPNQIGVYECKRAGFSQDNISIWDTSSSRGLEDAGKVIRESTDRFMQARSTGLRGTKSLFKLNTNLTAREISKNLQELKPDRDYLLIPVHSDSSIKDYVESWTAVPYRPGSTYYLLTKPETVQPYKNICIENKLNGKVYAGLNARNLLNLPDYEVKVSPVDYSDYNILIQSTSSNRKLLKGTKIIVLK